MTGHRQKWKLITISHAPQPRHSAERTVLMEILSETGTITQFELTKALARKPDWKPDDHIEIRCTPYRLELQPTITVSAGAGALEKDD